MKASLVCLFLFLSMITLAGNREKKIREYINAELKYHPEARLVDLYKNYFQDAYGPGHLISDTTKAGAYLDWELKQSDWTDTLLVQPLGIYHDYYRINLVLVKNGTIPRDTLLLGLLESAPLARKPAIEDWKKEWAEVLHIIKEIKPVLPDIESDEMLIDEVLNKGDVVMHHSKHYEGTYHPHYRIIHRSVYYGWETMINELK